MVTHCLHSLKLCFSSYPRFFGQAYTTDLMSIKHAFNMQHRPLNSASCPWLSPRGLVSSRRGMKICLWCRKFAVPVFRVREAIYERRFSQRSLQLQKYSNSISVTNWSVWAELEDGDSAVVRVPVQTPAAQVLHVKVQSLCNIPVSPH